MNPSTVFRDGVVSVSFPLALFSAVAVSLGVAQGCGPAEPQVASDVPEVKVQTRDISGPRPKGMPKTATFKIDPSTGRMMGTE